MDETPSQFAVALLHRMGIKPNTANVKALVGWQRAEGGHWNNDAKYNPLNTTQNMPGAGNTGTQGNIKVYKSWNQGIEATVKTLENGRYDHIIQALRGNSSQKVAQAIGSSPWGTSASSVSQIIGGVGKVSLKDGGATSGTTTHNGTSSQRTIPGSSKEVTTSDPDAVKRVALAQYLTGVNPNNLLLRTGAISVDEPTSTTKTVVTPPTTASAGARTPMAPGGGGSIKGGKSPLFELIHKGGPGYAVKNGQKVSGPDVYGAVWDGHADHVHVAAGPKTIVELGKLAQRMGLHVGENPHFGGVAPVHVSGSYHYKGEAIDVSGDPKRMNQYARKVEQVYGLA
jgi:hypothetical protein